MTKFLGKNSQYPTEISQHTLDLLPRNRSLIEANGNKNSNIGIDIWNCYEISSAINNKYVTMSLTFSIDSNSTHIVESKSLKLYLNAYYATNFQSMDKLKQRLSHDFDAAGLMVENLSIHLFPHNATQRYLLHEVIERGEDNYGFSIARISNQKAAIWPYFRSVCPITNQPDWAWVVILFEGLWHNDIAANLNHTLSSYREKPSFHEQCADEIWSDISQTSNVKGLTMLFNRRGGIEINPSRGWIPTANFKSTSQ